MELPEIEAARQALAEERAAWRAEEAEELDAVREGGLLGCPLDPLERELHLSNEEFGC